jgi:phage terminase large subunit-like protein
MLIEQVNSKFAAYLSERRRQGATSFAFCGGRRSGKTFFVAQFLTTRAYMGEVVNVASMTQRQGRLGAYADFKNIITDSPTLNATFECLLSPLEIRNRVNGGLILFNSYANSETAKGIPCDWLFINEANNFSKLQVTDLRANVREGWIIDYNPSCRFWSDDYFKPSEVCHTTWRDNPFLTKAQLEYFDELKRAALAADATAMDTWLYRTYYLGELSELAGAIFAPTNIQRVAELPSGLYQYVVFCDPSDLRGADYFACVLCATDGRAMYVVDCYSPNVGTDETVVEVLRQWCGRYPVERLLIESNGSIGRRFYEYAANSGLPAVAWWSKGDKFERITANYQDLTRCVFFADTDAARDYLQQVYQFDRKCEHDDNIDAVNSALNYYKWSRYIEGGVV